MAAGRTLRVSIHVCPLDNDDRLLPGQWEGDLIKGANDQSAVGVLVERSTRLVWLCKMPDATAETALAALAAFTAKLNHVIGPMSQTLTNNEGDGAPSGAGQGNREAGIVCDPHSPQQRGSCASTNGCCASSCPREQT